MTLGGGGAFSAGTVGVVTIVVVVVGVVTTFSVVAPFPDVAGDAVVVVVVDWARAVAGVDTQTRAIAPTAALMPARLRERRESARSTKPPAASIAPSPPGRGPGLQPHPAGSA